MGPLAPQPTSLPHDAAPAAGAAQLARHRWVHANALICAMERSITSNDRLGVATTKAQLKNLDTLRAGSRLLLRLPLYSVAAVLEMPENDVLTTPSGIIVHFMVEKVCSSWGPSTIQDAANTLDRLSAWMVKTGIPAEATLTGLQVAQFLEDVETTVRDNCSAKMAARDPTSTMRPLTGKTVAPSIKKRLTFLSNHFYMRVAASSKVFAVSAPPVQTPSVPSESLPVAVVACMERAATDPSRGVFVRVACAFFAFLAVGCIRFEQAQGFRFGAEIPGCRCFEGHILLLEKHPDPSKQGMRPAYIATSGLTGSAYLRILTASLEGVPGGDFLLRDTDSPSGDPHKATRFLLKPMSHDRALIAIRSILVSVCGLTPAQAARFGTHSPRHFLPEVALARGIPVEDRCEVGRWSGSSSHDPDLLPSERDAMAWRRRHAAMPDLYAPKAKVMRICKIVTSQLQAAREVLARHPPFLGGWDMF